MGRLALALAALSLPVAAQELPACGTLPEWRVAQQQLGVTLKDALGDRVLARSANKKWAASSDKLVFRGQENWFAIDTLKRTVCGPVAETSMFSWVASGDENDVHFTVVPRPDDPVSGLLEALSSVASVTTCDLGTGAKDQPCIYSETTPNQDFERALCSPAPGQPGVVEGQCSSPGGRTFTGPGWQDLAEACLRGPLVLERMHSYRPEIHPAETLWGRAPGEAGKLRWLLAVVRDASQRFDEPGFFSPWGGELPPVVPWGAPFSEAPQTVDYTLWFAAPPGAALELDVQDTRGPGQLPKSGPSPVAGGSPWAMALRTDDTTSKLRVSAQAVCRAEGGAIGGRIDLQLQARQSRPPGKSKAGRKGASEALAVLVSLGGQGLAVPEPVEPAPPQPLTRLRLPETSLRLLATVVPDPRPNPRDAQEDDVELDLVFAAAEAGPREQELLEVFDRARESKDARARVFSSRPSQRDHPYELDLRLTARRLGSHEPVALREWNLGRFPEGCNGKVLYKVVSDPLVTLRVAAGDEGTLAAPTRDRVALPSALARVELCRPKDVMVQGTLLGASAMLMGRQLHAAEPLPLAFQVGESCDQTPDAKRQRLRAALLQAWGSAPGFEAFLSSSQCEFERTLSTSEKECSALAESQRLFARASYAFGLSLANDCPGAADAADGRRGTDVLEALVRSYRGERPTRVRPSSAR